MMQGALELSNILFLKLKLKFLFLKFEFGLNIEGLRDLIRCLHISIISNIFNWYACNGEWR